MPKQEPPTVQYETEVLQLREIQSLIDCLRFNVKCNDGREVGTSENLPLVWPYWQIIMTSKMSNLDASAAD